MALFRTWSPRGALVAFGVPAAFVATAVAQGLPLAPAQATSAQATSALSTTTTAVARDFSVHRAAVLDARRIVHRAFTVNTDDPVAFLTIDDGVVKDHKALAYVRAHQVPITAFVSTWTVKDRADYFTQITQWGSIQNHSATHASFARRTTDLDHEICYSQRFLDRTFGVRPWMIRPPYGAGAENATVLRTAMKCGVREVVLWDAYVHEGTLSSTRPLAPGTVVLLHFSKNLVRDLRVAMAALDEAGLSPANLADYLPRPAAR